MGTPAIRRSAKLMRQCVAGSTSATRISDVLAKGWTSNVRPSPYGTAPG